MFRIGLLFIIRRYFLYTSIQHTAYIKLKMLKLCKITLYIYTLPLKVQNFVSYVKYLLKDIRYIKHNNPQSAHALHILNNKHECSPINNTIILIKPINTTTLLLPYIQLYNHSYHHHKHFIPEQHTGEHNHIYQPIYNLHKTSLPTRPSDQYSNIHTT